MNEMKPEDVMKENDFLVRGISKEQLAEERVQALCEGYQATLRKNDALIAKLEAYIDELNEDKSYLVGQIADLQQMVLKKNAEIERLKKANQNFAELENGYIVTGYKNIRADAITEFAERLKEAVKYIPWCDYPPVHNCIDEIAEKLKGETE